jgi:hypothetical protein
MRVFLIVRQNLEYENICLFIIFATWLLTYIKHFCVAVGLFQEEVCRQYVICVTGVLVALEIGYCNVFLAVIRSWKLYETS